MKTESFLKKLSTPFPLYQITGRGSRFAPVLTAGALMALLFAAPASGTVIDFEDLDANGPGSPGLPVSDQYADRGITFNFPDALDYSKGPFALPGFAHSGTKAVELCYSQEFCTVPLGMSFTTGQDRVKVWVGYDAIFGSTLDSPQTVVLRAFDASGAQIGQDTATLGPTTDRNSIPIAIPLEVRQSGIAFATFGFLGSEAVPPEIFENSLAVDDVQFSVPDHGATASLLLIGLVGLCLCAGLLRHRYQACWQI
jgi:hypothetical protein